MEKREQVLRAQELVLESIDTRNSGEKDYSLQESETIINELIKGCK